MNAVFCLKRKAGNVYIFVYALEKKMTISAMSVVVPENKTLLPLKQTTAPEKT